jgi:hypothetical protein
VRKRPWRMVRKLTQSTTLSFLRAAGAGGLDTGAVLFLENPCDMKYGHHVVIGDERLARPEQGHPGLLGFPVICIVAVENRI